MGFINFIKENFKRMFLNKEANQIFGIQIPDDSKMNSFISQWYDITSGNPVWLDSKDDIRTLNFAQYIGDVTAGLVTLDIDITMPDSPMGEYLQSIADYVLQGMDEKVSSALCNAGIIFKPAENKVDYYYPGSFIPTDWDSNGNILGCMFMRRRIINNNLYTKFEYHRFENINDERVYLISNRAFKNTNVKLYSNMFSSRGDPCKLSEVPEWADLAPDIAIYNVDVPLFAYYGNPKPNFIDRLSPLKIPLWAICTEELKNLDIAWSRKSAEIEDSKHITLLPEMAIRFAESQKIKLPRFFKGVQTSIDSLKGDSIHEHVATLLTEQRIADINSNLAMISTKIGYEQGFFVLDEKGGLKTATEIEADDQSTIRTIKNLRDPLKAALLQLLYGAVKLADIYLDIPAEDWTNNFKDFCGKLSEAFHWGDITYSYEEDKTSWWKYRIQGDVPPWKYYVKFEGMSEEEAKAMVEEAQPKESALFGESEE